MKCPICEKEAHLVSRWTNSHPSYTKEIWLCRNKECSQTQWTVKRRGRGRRRNEWNRK